MDYVSEEAAQAGKNAAAFVKGGRTAVSHRGIPLKFEGGPRYTVPAAIDPSRMPDTLMVRFRVACVIRNHYISVYFDDERLLHKKRQIMTPGEMEEVKLPKGLFDERPNLKMITIRVEEA